MMRERGRFGLRFRVVLAVSALVAMPGWAAAVGGLSVSAATAAAGGAATVAAYKERTAGRASGPGAEGRAAVQGSHNLREKICRHGHSG